MLPESRWEVNYYVDDEWIYTTFELCGEKGKGEITLNGLMLDPLVFKEKMVKQIEEVSGDSIGVKLKRGRYKIKVTKTPYDEPYFIIELV
ncbi:hypothetical protein DRJ19_04490 [Candidatus Woesearchaeota archaeon]|nr:MAG: hypothetical protein DRJ19_04490 [Candidatus Woesearchaeota archaeon]